jgi:outer membrane lipoprotein carrier protein
VLINKQAKMRWDYTAPEKKLFVSDGTKIYFYIPADKQVIVSSVPPDAAATTPALFLAGKGRLTTEFTPSLIDLPAGLPAGSRALKLVPKSAIGLRLASPRGRSGDARYSGAGHHRRAGGTSTFAFTNLKENVGMADNQFMFKIPRGVDVVSDTPRS